MNMISGTILLIILPYICSLRPVWNIGHMVNNKHQIDEFLNLGANGVETDIKFSSNGVALYTSHGIPCDCGRDCLRWDNVGEFLDHVSDLSTPGNPRFRAEFVLVTLDLKLKHFSTSEQGMALRDLANKLVFHLWKNGPAASNIKVLIHLPHTSGIPAVQNFVKQLADKGLSEMNQRVGWDVYGDEPIQYINGLWESLNLSTNNWQGDGITNCLPRSTWRLREAIAKREQGHRTFTKVYYWTVDRRSTIRDTLRIGVDAIMTNYPNRVLSVLQEPEFQREVRLATNEDNPFQMYHTNGKMARMRAASIPDKFYNQEAGDNKTAKF